MIEAHLHSRYICAACTGGKCIFHPGTVYLIATEKELANIGNIPFCATPNFSAQPLAEDMPRMKIGSVPCIGLVAMVTTGSYTGKLLVSGSLLKNITRWSKITTPAEVILPVL